jgi:anti-anti-sigma factor
MRPTPSVLRVYQTDDCDIVTFPAEVDLLNDQKIRTQLLWLLNTSPRGVILDLSGTRFCAACGVDAIFRACIRAKALGIRIGLLTPPSGPVSRIVHITGLNRTIPTTTDRTEALAALHAYP